MTKHVEVDRSTELFTILAAIEGHLSASAEALDEARRLTAKVHAMAVERGIANLPESTAPASEHRRLHRSGRPPKIDSDPELQAFIAARVDSMTFDQIAEAVSQHFAADRRVRRTAIHQWWQLRRRRAQSMVSE